MESQKDMYNRLKSECRELTEMNRQYELEKQVCDHKSKANIRSNKATVDNIENEIKIYKLSDPEKYENLRLQKITLDHNRHLMLVEQRTYNTEYYEKYSHNKNTIKELEKEIKRLENMENMKIMIDDNIKNIDGYNLLNENELIAITSNIDKTDYTRHNVPRWLDLEKIIKRTIQIKKYYPEWTLVSVDVAGQRDCIPPEREYSYRFVDNLKLDIRIYVQ
jgi:hypothetical protein